MRIAVSGASGLVGSALTEHLRAAGGEVTRLIRRPQGGFESIPDCDTVVHLAGESVVGGRWTAARKRRIRESRVEVTGQLVQLLGNMERPPATLICASAIGYYGDRGDERLDETSSMGAGFLAEVCRDWEAAAAAANSLGVRVVHLRIGMVLSASGGVLSKLRRPFSLGIGGRLGDGRQWTSWIHIEDLVRMIAFLSERRGIAGVLNAVAPEPVTNLVFTKALGRALRRPTILPVPKFALRLLVGELADGLLLASTAAIPRRMIDEGFEHEFPDLDQALSDLT